MVVILQGYAWTEWVKSVEEACSISWQVATIKSEKNKKTNQQQTSRLAKTIRVNYVGNYFIACPATYMQMEEVVRERGGETLKCDPSFDCPFTSRRKTEGRKRRRGL